MTLGCEQAFQPIRTAIIQALLLEHSSMEVLAMVTTDASGTAIGATLPQVHGNKEIATEYANRTPTPNEDKLYSSVWECIAVHRASPSSYLIGKKFADITDNWTVACLTKNAKPSRRGSYRCSCLVKFGFNVQHRPGPRNVVAEHLPCLSCATTPSSQPLKAVN